MPGNFQVHNVYIIGHNYQSSGSTETHALTKTTKTITTATIPNTTPNTITIKTISRATIATTTTTSIKSYQTFFLVDQNY